DDALDQLDAAAVAEVEVGEHGVGPGRADDGHGPLHAIGDPGHGHAAGLEQADEAAPVDRVIVDDDNAQLLHTSVIRGDRRWCKTTPPRSGPTLPPPDLRNSRRNRPRSTKFVAVAGSGYEIRA